MPGPVTTLRRSRMGPPQPFSLRSASGLCTASLPLFSLRTRYCGSSELARTVRLAAFVSSVIFSSTVPWAVLPWLSHSTLSPFLKFFSLMAAIYPLSQAVNGRLQLRVHVAFHQRQRRLAEVGVDVGDGVRRHDHVEV